MTWVLTSSGWRHRPRWKIIINGILRALQPWRRKWVVYTKTYGGTGMDDTNPVPPMVLGYGFGRIEHLP